MPSENESRQKSIPDWLVKTDAPVKFVLQTEIHNDVEQEIEVSASEYIRLKCHLARLRGIDFNENQESYLLTDHGEPPISGRESEDKPRDEYERKFMDTCRRIYRHESGCNTPTEQFLTELIRWYGSGGQDRFTPAEVEDVFKEYREQFENMVDDAREFVKRYPKEVGVGAAEATTETAEK